MSEVPEDGSEFPEDIYKVSDDGSEVSMQIDETPEEGVEGFENDKAAVEV